MKGLTGYPHNTGKRKSKEERSEDQFLPVSGAEQNREEERDEMQYGSAATHSELHRFLRFLVVKQGVDAFGVRPRDRDRDRGREREREAPMGGDLGSSVRPMSPSSPNYLE